jgi:hypothetical protein
VCARARATCMFTLQGKLDNISAAQVANMKRCLRNLQECKTGVVDKRGRTEERQECEHIRR